MALLGLVATRTTAWHPLDFPALIESSISPVPTLFPWQVESTPTMTKSKTLWIAYHKRKICWIQ